MNGGKTRVPFAADIHVLKALARELAGLASAGLKLQDLIGAEVRTGKLGTEAMLDAQAADHLSQQLQELAKFLETYSDALQREDADPIRVATGCLVLGALAKRLQDPGGILAPASSASGDLEMF